MATKPDCVHYDWGDTAPREYGAFCKVTCEALSESTCEGCELYENKNELNGNERWLKESLPPLGWTDLGRDAGNLIAKVEC